MRYATYETLHLWRNNARKGSWDPDSGDQFIIHVAHRRKWFSCSHVSSRAQGKEIQGLK